jgi:CRISPR-associated protein Csm1
MQEEALKTALAGLLHDIGKPAQRAGQLGQHTEIGAGWIEQMRDIFPRGMWKDLANGVAEHHAKLPHKRIARVVQLANWLAAGEQLTEGVPNSESMVAPLSPVLSQLALLQKELPDKWEFDVNVLNLDNLFPQEGLKVVAVSRYAGLWAQFEDEIERLRASGVVINEGHFTTLLFLLRKYLTFVPSVMLGTGEAERTRPNVSLYDHLKVTAAIAICLERGLKDDELDRLLHHEEAAWQQPVALMVRGDLSGIQSFIYRITRPAEDITFRGVAKRLRGRSFYLTLLGDVAGDWLLRKLGLPAANLLFCGGGRFDLLIPTDTDSQQKLVHCLGELEDWLLKTFQGELGFQFVMEGVRPTDFGDMGRLYAVLEHKLAQSKTQKWKGQMQQDDFFVSTKDEYHACPVCQLTPMDEPRICQMCQQHHQIGAKLPDTTWMAFVYDAPSVPQGAVSVLFGLFDTTVLLMNDEEVETFLLTRQAKTCTYPRFLGKIRELALLPALKRPKQENPGVLYRLNDTSFIPEHIAAGWGLGFRFLANTVPVALKQIALSGRESPTDAGDVLDFEEIAELSMGAKYLGVLKADVDHLGLLFSDGLKPLTISRQAALSHATDLFFCGWLNRLCGNVLTTWKEGAGQAHPWRDKVSNLFYVLYSGGDDLFIVGPWDQILELASQLEADFAHYVCHNPNVTLSAGVVPVKPRYPVQRFSQEVSQAEKRAKDGGRNKITLFNHTVPWHGATEGKSLAWLMRFAQSLQARVEAKQVPRTLIHDLGRLYRRHRQEKNGQLKPMWHPRLFYTLARRLPREVRDELLPDILCAIVQHTLLVAVSYVSLITRKE